MHTGLRCNCRPRRLLARAATCAGYILSRTAGARLGGTPFLRALSLALSDLSCDLSVATGAADRSELDAQDVAVLSLCGGVLSLHRKAFPSAEGPLPRRARQTRSFIPVAGA